jgi:malate permease and related proteins
MDHFLLFFQELSLLYSIGLLGFILRKRQVLPEGTERVLTAVILNVTLPALILYGMDVPFSIKNLATLGWFSLMSTFILCVSSFISASTVRKIKTKPGQKNALEGIMIFGNQGFLGVAVCFLLFGKEGVFYATLFNFFYLLWIWTYAIYLFARDSSTVRWRKVFFNPGVVSTLFGLVLMVCPGTLPVPLLNVLEILGRPTVPLSMLLIGALLGTLDVNELIRYAKNKLLWLASFYKLLLFPFMLLPFLLFSLPFKVIAIAVLVAGMPSAPTISMYAQQYREDSAFAAAGVALSTMLSFITIPLLYFFLLIIPALS